MTQKRPRNLRVKYNIGGRMELIFNYQTQPKILMRSLKKKREKNYK